MIRTTIVLALLALTATTAAPAHAAGRCGDVAQRPWCDTSLDPDTRAGLLLAALTKDEKISLLAGDELTGVSGRAGSHTGTSLGVERVGLPTIYFSDGPVGTRQGKSTAMPSSMSLAATFDRDAAVTHGSTIGDEAKKKGNDVVYAPAVNMMRTPLNGRTFEYYGEDPFLSGQIAASWTHGVQGAGVIGNVKHFAVNNQEGQGPPLPASPPVGVSTDGTRFTVDARVSERALREIYLPQFEDVVKAGVGSVMCSYPRINGQYACENQHLLEDILKGDWGFDGFVLTDYLAGKNTIASLNNGLDLDIFPGAVYSPPLVTAALATSQASDAAVDEHVRRILRTLFKFGFFDRDAYKDDATQIDQAGHDKIAGDLETQGIVLLENDGGILPLDAAKTGKLALIGPEIDKIKNGGGSSAIDPFQRTTAKTGIEKRIGAEKVVTDDGSDAARAAAAAKAADVAVIVVGDDMTEGVDKPCMGLSCGSKDSVDRDALIEAVAAAQPRTVVVLQSGGPVTTPWRDKVPGLLEAWFPGQNGGTAMARVLFGDSDPGGRLPATFPLSESDLPTSGDKEAYPGIGETVQYKEGVLIGYRWFDTKKKGVAYPFGYGLSYTNFSYSGLTVTPGSDAKVTVVVKNTGSREGSAVPQLYVGMPALAGAEPMPPWQLKGFQRVTLKPGEKRRVTLGELEERAFSHWDTNASRWEVSAGCYRIGVGGSSRDLPLRAVVGRGSSSCAGALELPRNAAACTAKRSFGIHLPATLAKRPKVTVDGRAARVRGRAGAYKSTIALRGAARETSVVKISGRTKGGRAVRQARVYRVCG